MVRPPPATTAPLVGSTTIPPPAFEKAVGGVQVRCALALPESCGNCAALAISALACAWTIRAAAAARSRLPETVLAASAVNSLEPNSLGHSVEIGPAAFGAP